MISTRTVGDRAFRFARSSVSPPLNALLTIAILVGLALTIPRLLDWALLDAVWTGASGRDCSGKDGACWIFIGERLGQILYGSYPVEERWRANLTAGLGALGIVALMLSSAAGMSVGEKSPARGRRMLRVSMLDGGSSS